MKLKTKIKTGVILILASVAIVSCKRSVLDEVPQNFYSPENLKDAATFQTATNTLYSDLRNFTMGEIANSGMYMRDYLRIGTDVATSGQRSRPYQMVDFSQFNPQHEAVNYYWDASYTGILPRANLIISRASKPGVTWASDAEKNGIIAQAKFFRAYSYNTLIGVYGDVPLITEEITTPRYDYVRTPTKTILDTIRKDLEFASKWLPKDPDALVSASLDGRLTSAAADQLLTDVYLHLNMPDSAISSSSRIIKSGKYNLMTTLFGDANPQGRDVYSNLFWEDNPNRRKGNRESLLVIQFKNNAIGGAPKAGHNGLSRAWGPAYFNMVAPNGKAGMTLQDSLYRPAAFCRPTNYFFYDVWNGTNANDMRNSKFNIRRTWYYNNAGNPTYFGKKIDYTTLADTIETMCSKVRKVEGIISNLGASITPDKDWALFRLAETYLYRAEAYLQKGDLINAAADINVVRARSNAKLVDPSEVNISYILDERARELIVEEPRRLTLNRLGLWYTRTLQYSIFAITKQTIQPYNNLFPIPQKAIDANSGAVLAQNPGYPK
ncbi:RagB/SusD family nutrient uptake outer membrane protein [Pedobacter changchengzhani]|uniref:RagB/SusD family nutrient uptake outer membrane protein n=1 Tax=Pedobacter changchengzhani TaxID=2529274 RepID=A0A4R5ML54_9SPHI|nr:RagB/SusD family nutrient uptake outer membrane protein [Pedobacter changchengzhani]TDG36176.1 RagB/SusD family nutrient uptake outer membrane protein [Pedobacter changchengzhani]